MRVPEIAQEARVRVAIKYALEMVWHAPLYLAPVAPPIAVLIPDRELGTERPAFDERLAETEPWATLFWSEILEREFSSYDEVAAFADGLRSSNELLDAIKRHDVFRLHEDSAADPRSQWRGVLEDGSKYVAGNPRDIDSPRGILNMTRSRLMMANDILNTAYAFDAQPLIGAPLSFHYTVWRGRAIQDKVADALGSHVQADLTQTNALLGAGLDWLGNVTDKQLLLLREKGRLEEMRELFRGATNDLKGVAVQDLETVSRAIDYKLEQGLRRHEEEIRAKDEAFRDDLKIKGGSLIISAFGALSPLIWAAPPAWLGLLGIVGAANVSQITSALVKHSREEKQLKSAPIAILLDMKRAEEAEIELGPAPAVYIQPMPEFDWDPGKIGGVAYMIPKLPEAKTPIFIGPAFNDAVFATAFFRLLRAWNSGEDRDEEDNIKMSFVIEAEKSYSLFLYPSMDRREIREHFERLTDQRDEQLVSQWVFCKRFNMASVRGLELFAERCKDGREFFLAAFSWEEGGTPDRLTGIRPLIKRHFKVKRREELQPNEVEFWTGGD